VAKNVTPCNKSETKVNGDFMKKTGFYDLEAELNKLYELNELNKLYELPLLASKSL
jgi:hypothetical protein